MISRMNLRQNGCGSFAFAALVVLAGVAWGEEGRPDGATPGSRGSMEMLGLGYAEVNNQGTLSVKWDGQLEDGLLVVTIEPGEEDRDSLQESVLTSELMYGMKMVKRISAKGSAELAIDASMLPDEIGQGPWKVTIYIMDRLDVVVRANSSIKGCGEPVRVISLRPSDCSPSFERICGGRHRTFKAIAVECRDLGLTNKQCAFPIIGAQSISAKMDLEIGKSRDKN